MTLPRPDLDLLLAAEALLRPLSDPTPALVLALMSAGLLAGILGGLVTLVASR